MNKSIKYRIYPTTEQKIYFSKTFGCCRKLWNLMLSDREESYKATGKIQKKTPAMYKKDYPYLKEVDSLALSAVYVNLDKAYKNFFKNPKHFGKPVFKSKKSNNSYLTNNQHGTVAIIDNKYIKFPKIGLIKAKIHRAPEDNWVLRSATVSLNKAGEYYISVLFKYEEETKPTTTLDAIIGLDYKSDGLYTDSNGTTLGSPKFFRKSQKRLTKAQRRLSKKQKGSNNYLKQSKKVNKIHEHIANQRKDFLHKTSTKIANSYDVVCVESLNMKAMSNKGFKNGKATMDNGYGMFLNFLEYKLNDRGKYFIKVDKWFPSSQVCSECGLIHPEMRDLSKRTLSCECGNTIDRDLNAAINIKKEGLRLLNEMLAA